jgi:hypothetical protein
MLRALTALGRTEAQAEAAKGVLNAGSAGSVMGTAMNAKCAAGNHARVTYREISMSDYQVNKAVGIVDKLLCDGWSDEENCIRDLVTALMHYATRDGQDAIEEVRWGIWHWYDEHANPDNIADQDPEHIVEISIKHKHSALFEALLNHGPPAANPHD